MITPLRSHREKLKLISRQVAIAVGLEPSHYRRIEMGEAQASPKAADRIAKHFKNAVTRDQILYPEDYAQPAKPARATRRAQLQEAS